VRHYSDTLKQEVWDLRKAGWKYPAIAEKCDIVDEDTGEYSAKIAYRLCRHMETNELTAQQVIANNAPADIANAIVALAQPGVTDTLQTIADEIGVDVAKVKAIKAACDHRLNAFKVEAEEGTAKALHKAHGALAVKFGEILLGMDDELLGRKMLNNPHRLSAAMAIHTDKMRLLEGNATDIVEIRDRRSIDELTDTLLDMAKKRGIVDAEYEVIP